MTGKHVNFTEGTGDSASKQYSTVDALDTDLSLYTSGDYSSGRFQTTQFLLPAPHDEGWVSLNTKRAQQNAPQHPLVRLDDARNSFLLPLQMRPFARIGIWLNIVDLLIILLFLSTNIIVIFWGTTSDDWKGIFNGGSDKLADNTGWLLYWCYALLLLPITRKSVVFLVTGASYERAVRYHRWMGRYIFVMIFVHWSLVLRYYGQLGGSSVVKSVLSNTRQIYGEVALCSTFMIVLTSLSYMRRKHFEIFYNIHLVMFVVTFYYGAKHKDWQVFLYMTCVPLALWFIDIGYRCWCLARRRKVISLEVVDDMFCRLEVQRFDGEIMQAGQFMNVYIWEAAIMQWHPISILSSPMDSNYRFLIKADGSWSKKLLKVAKTKPEALKHIRLEGPYGSLTIKPLREYKMLLMIAGGVGVTPIMSCLKDLLQFDESSHMIGRHCTMVWSSRSTGLFQHFAELIGTMQHDYSWDMHLHSSEPSFTGAVDEEWALARLPEIRRGRPSLQQIFADVRSAAAARKNVHRIGVFVCGPDSMIKQAQQLGVSCSDGTIRFDVHLETFNM